MNDKHSSVNVEVGFKPDLHGDFSTMSIDDFIKRIPSSTRKYLDETQARLSMAVRHKTFNPNDLTICREVELIIGKPHYGPFDYFDLIRVIERNQDLLKEFDSVTLSLFTTVILNGLYVMIRQSYLDEVKSPINYRVIEDVMRERIKD